MLPSGLPQGAGQGTGAGLAVLPSAGLGQAGYSVNPSLSVTLRQQQYVAHQWSRFVSFLHRTPRTQPNLYEWDEMSGSFPVLEPFHCKGVDQFLHEVKQKALVDVELKRGAGSVTPATFFQVLDSLPKPHSRHADWWATKKATFLADAAAHAQAANPAPAAAAAPAAPAAPAAANAWQLFDYYKHILTEHFKAEAEQTDHGEFTTAVQGDGKPSDFYQRLSTLHAGLAGRVSTYQLADRFVEGLQPTVREHIHRDLMRYPRTDWHNRMAQTVVDADRIWENLTPAERKASGSVKRTEKVAEKTTPVQPKPAQSKEGLYLCKKHGWNTSHATADCRQLQNQSRSKPAMVSTGAAEGIVQQLVALLTQNAQAGQASASAQKPRKPGAAGAGSGSGAGHSGQSRSGPPATRGRAPRGDLMCDFCKNPGHSRDRCFIEHPQLAPPGFKPTSPALQVLFELQKARAPKVAAVADVVEDDFAEEDYQSAAAFFTFTLGEDEIARPSVDTELSLTSSILPAPVPPEPKTAPQEESELAAALATVTAEDQAREFAAKLQTAAREAHLRVAAAAARQPLPQGFQPLPLDTGSYPVPAVPRDRPPRPPRTLDEQFLERVSRMSVNELARVILSGRFDEEEVRQQPQAVPAPSVAAATNGSTVAPPASSLHYTGLLLSAGQASEGAPAGSASSSFLSVPRAVGRDVPPLPTQKGVAWRRVLQPKSHLAEGFDYEVVGSGPVPPRPLSAMTPGEREMALRCNPLASRYLSNPSNLYYYPERACALEQDGRLVYVPTLRDFAATASLMPTAVALRYGFIIRPTATRLSTSAQLGCTVRGEVSCEGMHFTLLPDTPHETRVPLTQVLVVDVAPHLFSLLVGNELAKLFGDGLDSYPTPRLHFHPNFVEHPEYRVTIPMRSFISKDTKAANVAVACVTTASSISFPSAPELGGGEDGSIDCEATVPTHSAPSACESAQQPSHEQPGSNPGDGKASAAKPSVAGTMSGVARRLAGGVSTVLIFALSMLLTAVTTSCAVATAAAKQVGPVLDFLVNSACMATWSAPRVQSADRRPSTERKGKRKRVPRAAWHRNQASPPPLRRTWGNLASFALITCLLFSLAAGAGAMHGAVLQSDLAAISSNLVTSGGILLQHGGVRPSASSGLGYDPWAEADPGDYAQWDTRGHAVAMTSVGSFTPEGHSAAAAYQRYQKDSDGGWIWGNSSLFDSHTSQSLRETVRARKAMSFAYSMEELPGYSGDQGPFTLDLDTERPIVQPPRRYSPKEKEVIVQKTAELMKAGIVREHTGATVCAVNPVIAAKKDPDTGMWTDHRMAQDYRPVNKHTRSDRYGLHRPEDIFHQCAKAKVFSKLDLRQGFLQIPIAKDDQPKTAYWVGNKLMMYERMPYGLKNASAKFQRVMDYELAKAGLDHCARAYIDDVLIFSSSPEEHLKQVAAVLDMLHSCGLRAHPDKSIFGADVIEYLGHNLSAQGISPHHAKVSAIMALQPPKNVSELRAHLGFINYYRCYIPNMSQLTTDLTVLLKKDQPWVWGPAQEAAFAALKAVFAKEGLILRPIDYSKPLILHTDFSNKGLGAVLGQLDDEGNEYMCACISRSLNKHERNYSSYKGEMLAAVWAVKMLRHHLLGGPKFSLVTDHQPLTYLMSADGLTGQYARFALVLQEYDFEVIHRPGLKHQNADLLSRYPEASSADNTGARLDEDVASARRVAAALSYSAHDFVSLSVALASHVPHARFSDEHCFVPDYFLAGNLGLPTDLLDAPPVKEPDLVRERRDALHASAVKWVRNASRDNPALFAQGAAHPDSRAFFSQAMGKGVTVYEPLGGMCSGLESLLRCGVKVNRYISSEPDLAAAKIVSQRLDKLSAEYPAQLSPDAYRRVWLDLPLDPCKVTEDSLMAAGACDGSHWIVFASWCWHDVGKNPGSLAPDVCAVDHVVRIVQTLQRVQRRAPSYFLVCEQPRQSWQNARAAQARVDAALGGPVVVDAAQFGSLAHRVSVHWTNLAQSQRLSAVVSAVQPASSAVLQDVLSSGRTVKPARAPDPPGTCARNIVGEPIRVAPSLSRPDQQHLFDLVSDPCDPDLGTLTAQECLRAMGYPDDAADAPDVSDAQRRRIIGLAPDLTSTVGVIALCKILSNTSLYDVAAACAVTAEQTSSPEEVHGLAYPLFPLEPVSPWLHAFAAATQAEQDDSAGSQGRWPDVWEDEASMHFLRAGKHLPDLSFSEQKRVTRRVRSYRMQGGELYRVFNDSKIRLVPKPSDRVDLIKRTHEETGHFGVRRTVALLLTRHWWHGLYRDVVNLVKHCEHCDRVNTSFSAPSPDLHPLPVQGLFYRWGVDLCGPFARTNSGNVYVMICVEHFSKYAVFVPLPDKEADHTASAFLHHILGRYGACAEVCTDQGSEWKGSFSALLLSSLIDHRETSPNHPQANGLAERVVQTCKRALRRMARQRAEGRDWDDLLPYIMLGYNCSVHQSTGFSPYLIMHGVEPTIPPAIKPRFVDHISFDDPELAVSSLLSRGEAMRQRISIAGDNLLIAQHRDTLRYAALRGGGYHPKVREFEVGDYVYHRNTTSQTTLDPAAKPTILRVIEVRPTGVLVLQGHDGLTIKAHIKDCAPCHLPIRDETVDPRLARPSALLPCQACHSPSGDEWMLLCDGCGTGWHTYCLKPPLRHIPEGTWVCPQCSAKGVTPQQVEARPLTSAPPVSAPSQPALQPPPFLKSLQGARVVRVGSAPGSQGDRTGVATYVGRQGRAYMFDVVYQDGSSEVVTVRQLRTMLAPPGPRPGRSRRATAAVTHVQPSNWNLGSGGAVAAALSVAMPGNHPVSKVALITSALASASFLGPAVPVEHAVVLQSSLDLCLLREAVCPWDVSPSVRSALLSHGIHVLKSKSVNPVDPLTPSFYESVQQQVSRVESVFLSAAGHVLDLAVPAAIRYAQTFVVARVPVSYVSTADEVRMRWLKSLQKQGRLLMLRCPMVAAEGSLFMWLVIFASPLIKQMVVKDSGFVEDLL